MKSTQSNAHMTISFPLLSRIQTPADLRQLPEAELSHVVQELRDFIIQTLDQCGGHFGANLGAVELTVALHAVFNTPEDRLLWDVGHQAYAHKILTGRRDLLHTIRKLHGLAPFPSRAESDYDAFGVGHSSTSISAALGMAIAAQKQGHARQAIAVIGDGGLTGGMAFEALNHAGVLDANLLVVLNDNKMSISENVGALTNYLARILSGKIYSSFREGSKKMLSALPSVKAFAKRTETHVKGMITANTLFEELGFHYFGPIDGHDLDTLLTTLRNLNELKGPRLLHVVTAKGKGYEPAESNPIEYHAVKPGFRMKNADAPIGVTTDTASVSVPTYSDIFGEWLCDVAAQDERLVAITPAMCEGSGMVKFSKAYKDRYFDVGIAEQHSLTVAAGMACEGLKPVVAIYSTFLQRAYDQLIHDIALQNLDVTLALDRAGLVGGDGATHNGSFDLSYLRCIPNLVVMAPANENECRQMLYTAYQYQGPAAVRYPRGQGPGTPLVAEMKALPIGKAKLEKEGEKIALLAFGSMLHPCLQAAEKLNATVVNMRFIKPLDTAMLKKIAAEHTLLVTVEENVVAGGAGSAVNEWLLAQGYLIQVLNLGLPDRFIEHGDHQALLANCGLDQKGIGAAIEKFQKSVGK
jgi:1-deoxy-D-xylulose-5-phosphate synthase